MPPEELRIWLRRVPFRPFRMFVLEVTSYEVHHPELIMIKLATLDYYFPAKGPSLPLAEIPVTIALRHISRLEIIPSAAQGKPVSGNGA